MNKGEFYEFHKRGAVEHTHPNDEQHLKDLYRFFGIFDFNLRKPKFADKMAAYFTLAIPAAMFARVVRKVSGRKGTLIEKYCMEHYYNMSVKILAKDS